MKYVDIIFGEYRPDFAGMPNPADPGYLVEATGVRPTPNGLKPIPLFANITDSTAVPAGTSIGRIYATEYAGTISVFACTAETSPTNTRIHQSNDLGVNWSDVEEASSLTVAPGLWADFCRFDEIVLATSQIAGGIHYKDLDDSVSTDFAETPDSPPVGASIARVRDSIVVGNARDVGGDKSRSARVVWGAIGTYDDWPTPGTAEARSKQAGEQFLPLDLGQITKVVGGEKFGLIFQQRGITRMTYVGGSTVFEFDTFEKQRGTGVVELDLQNAVIPHPVVDLGGGRWAWVNSNTGFYMTDGYSVRRISLGRFDRNFNNSGAANRSAAFDTTNNLALFIYAGNSSRYLIYNPDTDQVTWASDSSIRSICELPPLTTERGLLNISGSLILQQQTSATQETIGLQTGYIELEPGYRVQIQRAHLLGADVPGSLTLSYKVAANLDAVDAGETGFTAMTAVSRGEGASARVDAPYVAFRVTGAGSSGGYQTLRGIRVYYEKTSHL